MGRGTIVPDADEPLFVNVAGLSASVVLGEFGPTSKERQLYIVRLSVDRPYISYGRFPAKWTCDKFCWISERKDGPARLSWAGDPRPSDFYSLFPRLATLAIGESPLTCTHATE